LVVILYAGLNSIMWQNLPHQKALKLSNDLSFPECCFICAEQKPSCVQEFCQQRFCFFSYFRGERQLNAEAPSGDCPTKQCGLVSTKTSLTSAVVEPSVIPDNKSPLSTAASNSFSEIPEENAEYDPKSSYTTMKPTRNALLRSHPSPFMGLSGARSST
ncbi:hypothetical protein DV515_00002067, partial [Chloebia gouldiae]